MIFINHNYLTLIKQYIILLIIFINLLALSLNDFIIIWFFIELSNFLFLSLINFSYIDKKINFIYFLFQFLATSILILFYLILMPFFSHSLPYFYLIIILISLLIKLRIPPFHIWLIIIIKNLNWTILFLILTIQKLIPFYLFYLINFNWNLIILLILITSLYPPLILLNQTNNFIKIITFSSFNQSSWLLIINKLNLTIWFIYFYIYTIITLILILIIQKINKSFSFKIKYINNSNLFFLINILNIAGLPPFSFFILKWFRITIFIKLSIFHFIFIILIIRSFLITYIYLNILINNIYISNFSKLSTITYNYLSFNKFIYIFLISYLSLLPIIN